MNSAPQLVPAAGREIAVEDAGPEPGFPLLGHHGGSRHLFPGAVRCGAVRCGAVRDAGARGLRLISYDRPGQGRSAPQPGRVVAGCATDVSAIVAALGISRMAVWGTSAGGPYALATAAPLPGLVASVCLFAPLGPCGEAGLDFAADMGDGFRGPLRDFFDEPERARTDFLAGAGEWLPLGGDPSWWMGQRADRDQRDPACSRKWADYLALINRDGHGDTGEGWWADWAASFRPWGDSTSPPLRPRSSCGTDCGTRHRHPRTRAG